MDHDRHVDKVASEAYQIIGTLADLAGVFETDEIEKVLDYFSKGYLATSNKILPFHVETSIVFFKEIFEQHAAWSERTVAGQNPEGLVKHMHKEADEILANPKDGEEYIDQCLLSMDGYRRFAGGNSSTFLRDLKMKVDKLERRTYTMTDPNGPCEHVRDKPALPEQKVQDRAYWLKQYPDGNFPEGI